MMVLGRLVLSSGMTHREELALAERHVVQAKGRILHQLERIEHMEGAGQDTELAKDVLLALEYSLLIMQRHRELILAEDAQDIPTVSEPKDALGRA
jgi:hypothetical protein